MSHIIYVQLLGVHFLLHLYLLDSHSNSVPPSSGDYFERKGEVEGGKEKRRPEGREGGRKRGREDECLLKVMSIAT